MCDQNVFVVRNGREELVMEAVETIETHDGSVKVANIFGEEKVIEGCFKSWAQNKMVFEA